MLAGVALLAWGVSLAAGEPHALLSRTYNQSASLYAGYELYWTIADGTLSLGIVAETTGWVGFGLSQGGGMAGSDIVVGAVADDGTITVDDYWSKANEKPQPVAYIPPDQHSCADGVRECRANGDKETSA